MKCFRLILMVVLVLSSCKSKKLAIGRKVSFSAQVFVYLMSARALNQKKDCKKALEQLNNGIDFVIDDVLLEAAFYEERARSYDCLENAKEALENKNKAVSLRKKRKE